MTLGALLGVVSLQPTAVAAQPTIPDPAPVTLDAATTAYLVLDITDAVCGSRAACSATVPAIAAFLDRARGAGSPVIYSISSTGTVMPEVIPLEDEPTVQGRADKFYGTDLDELLRARGVRTVIIVGTAANGAVLYTTFGANLRGFTAVVAEDGISSDDPWAVTLTRYQVLNQPGFANPQNEPLREGSVTLSRTDLITLR